MLTVILAWCVVIAIPLSLFLSGPWSDGDSDDLVGLTPVSGEAVRLPHVATLGYEDVFCSPVLVSPSFHPPDNV